MKIALITIQGNSGNDSYFHNVRYALLQFPSVHVELIFVPHYMQYIPSFLHLLVRKHTLKRFDIIHTNIELAGFFRASRHQQIVGTFHHNVFESTFRKYTSYAQRCYHDAWLKPSLIRGIQRATCITTGSRSSLNSLQNTFRITTPAKIIHYGIDTQFFSPTKQAKDPEFTTPHRILFVGNPSRRKGFDVLTKIAEDLGDDFEIRFTSGLRNSSIVEYPRNMVPLGRIDNAQLLKEYTSCAALISPTRLEGFGLSICEAMACEKPIIASRCSSIPEIVQDGLHGYLCTVDNTEEFCSRTRQVIQELKAGRTFFHNRKQIVENFSLERMGKDYHTLYTSLLAERGANFIHVDGNP